MDYGRLGRTESDQREGSGNSSSINQPKQATSQVSPTRKKKIIFLTVLSVVLIAASAASAAILLGVRARASGQTDSLTHRKPTQAISKTCSKTRFPSLCVSSLLDFPGSMSASESDLVHISFNMTLMHLDKALYQSSGISFVNMETRERSAFDDCLELLEDSIDALSRSLTTFAPSSGGGGSTEDVVTWLSAALTNQDTCSEGFEGVINGTVKDQLTERLKDLTELVSNCLAIFSASIGGDFSGVPIQNKRRLMTEDWGYVGSRGEFSELVREQREETIRPACIGPTSRYYRIGRWKRNVQDDIGGDKKGA
ncbi:PECTINESTERASE [Salix viminalis]|uniref:pectinesterase n=1 Tax=Salix viminalis TaxID=40686 RepID=A0A9Q0NN64_SALVM|nr:PECTINESTERASE [Salix viminalis]